MSPTGTTCEKCGAAVAAGARFCMTCGADVSGRQGEVATKLVASSATQQFKQGLLHALRDATLGEYEILSELGSGGMATVYLAHDIHLDRKVAVKVMNPQLVAGAEMVERFKLEARTAAGLSHPNIIPIFAVKQQGDLLYFVMKFVEGRALDSIIKREAPLPVPMVRQILAKVADALGYAHRKGVVHRDIKPANIMIDTEGMPIVTDFGIAKVADTHGLTMTGATIGTPTYMSPEQCNAQPITGASDQYSLGVLAYEMLTGKSLFDGESVMTIMFKHVHEDPPPLHEMDIGCPEDLADAVMRMLGKEPDERFPSMEDVVKAAQAPAMAYDDPIRTQLVGYAMQGENRAVLQRVSTPRSPLPSAAGASRARAATAPRTGTTTRPSQEPTQVMAEAPPRRRRAPLAAVAGLVVVAAGVAVAVLQPWRPEGEQPAATPPAGEPALQLPAAPGATPTEGAGAGAGTPPVSETPAPTPPVTTPSRPAATPDAAVRTVRILGAPPALGVGETAVLETELRDAAGRLVTGRTVGWRSSAPAVVQIAADGRVTGVAPGTATVTAAVGAATGDVAVTVTPEAVAGVRVTPDRLTLSVGQAGRLEATVRGARGGLLDDPVQWTSSAPEVAAVSGGGEVAARAQGSAVITARAGGQAASAQVTVASAGLTEAELREQVATTVQEYARALQARDVSRVRELYPGMPAARERQLRDALPTMNDLVVTLNVGQVTITGSEATAIVTGVWRFRSGGQNVELPANETYRFQRSGTRWVIVEVR